MSKEPSDEELFKSVDNVVGPLVVQQRRDPSYAYQHVGALLKVCGLQIEKLGDALLDGRVTDLAIIGKTIERALHHTRTSYVLLARVVRAAEGPDDTDKN